MRAVVSGLLVAVFLSAATPLRRCSTVKSLARSRTRPTPSCPARPSPSPDRRSSSRWPVAAESGGFRFPGVPVGTYTVSFELPGFSKVVREGIIVQAGRNVEINIKLASRRSRRRSPSRAPARSSTPSPRRSGPTSAKSSSRRFRRHAIRGSSSSKRRVW